MSKSDFEAPPPEDFADPALAAVFATLPPKLQARFRAAFLTATRDTAPALFARVDSEMFFMDVADDQEAPGYDYPRGGK